MTFFNLTLLPSTSMCTRGENIYMYLKYPQSRTEKHIQSKKHVQRFEKLVQPVNLSMKDKL